MKASAALRCVLAMLLLGAAMLTQDAALAQEQPTKGKVVPAANVELAALDDALGMLRVGRRNYTAVKDYSCTLVSQERVRGKLEEVNIMQFKIKTRPFSIYMRWLAPRSAAGQEVAFVAGKNNNKMRVKSNTLGRGKLLGFVTVDPNDKRVLEHSRHTILEAGIGNMIEQNIRHLEIARAAGKTKVAIGEARYNDRDCVQIEILAKERSKDCYCWRSVLYLDKHSKLPIRQEMFDWPREGGPRGGDLLESFSYVNLQFNTGLKDSEFNK